MCVCSDDASNGTVRQALYEYGLSLRTCVASLSKCIRVCDEGLVEERKQGRFASTGKQKKIVKGN